MPKAAVQSGGANFHPGNGDCTISNPAAIQSTAARIARAWSSPPIGRPMPNTTSGSMRGSQVCASVKLALPEDASTSVSRHTCAHIGRSTL